MDPLCCSFCGRPQELTQKLITGPTSAICNYCVEMCLDILIEEGIPVQVPVKPNFRVDDDGSVHLLDDQD